MTLGDRFEEELYYIEAMDLFHLLDRKSKPNSNSLVAIDRLSNGQLVIERFHGQPHIGVVRVLKNYQLRQSGKRDPRFFTNCPG